MSGVIVGGIYRHFKGNLYRVEGVARHSETSEEMVVYRALYGDGGLWVRPLSMFTETLGDGAERFVYVADGKVSPTSDSGCD